MIRISDQEINGRDGSKNFKRSIPSQKDGRNISLLYKLSKEVEMKRNRFGVERFNG